MSHRAAPLLLLLLLPALSLPAAEKLDAKRLRMHEASGGRHDASFDQELLLGSGEAQKLKGMRRQQARERLAQLFDSQIDANSDGKASYEELVAWLAKVAERQILAETDSQWAALNASDRLSWSHYAKSEMPPALSQQLRDRLLRQLLANETPTLSSEVPASDEEKAAVQEFASEIGRKRRRWLKVDADNDGQLNKEEFKRLLFPEEFGETRDVVVDEELERLDTDRDGKISLAEFLADVWSPAKESEEKEPDWVEQERRDFKEKKDKDRDGFLDRKEIAAYLMDGEEKRELYRREARHLIGEADADKDGQLGRQEMLDNLELMAGSAATNFGDHLGLREEL